MNYEETFDYICNRIPAFHKTGSSAYKPGLERSMAFDDLAGNPHKKYKTIHVAGTNGKGSVAHLLAALLQALGHRAGLYTSPHLVDFRERIRVNGKAVTQQFVTDFVERNIKFIESEKPSFFELMSAMAFDYFRHKKVTYAVIETGMGGRLDSTNIIHPALSIITSISLDHTQYLGDTLQKIAGEKAGIIKRNVPVIIGEMNRADLNRLFVSKAFEMSSPITFATEKDTITYAEMQYDGSWLFETTDYGTLKSDLRGAAQKQNVQIALSALKVLSNSGVQIRLAAVRNAFSNTVQMTGLMGRWQELHDMPKIICDIGHNTGAWNANSMLLANEIRLHERTHMVIGISKDKDIDGILSLMPRDAVYYFTQASGERALPVKELAEKGEAFELKGKCYRSVKEAVSDAVKQASGKDFIFIGGSTFVVAEAFILFPNAIK
ncbi:MAG: bifunctional folylpolyglutamate synthase/dihydrofolate synthase [Tannerella sp.]|jgi:dihydrofolate synthase/folylpolyglutamate synthase|nr:bifunctional folylpolyglutamate synthase/dihydrofolate synthase [Tannerella sp.]